MASSGKLSVRLLKLICFTCFSVQVEKNRNLKTRAWKLQRCLPTFDVGSENAFWLQCGKYFGLASINLEQIPIIHSWSYFQQSKSHYRSDMFHFNAGAFPCLKLTSFRITLDIIAFRIWHKLKFFGRASLIRLFSSHRSSEMT